MQMRVTHIHISRINIFSLSMIIIIVLCTTKTKEEPHSQECNNNLLNFIDNHTQADLFAMHFTFPSFARLNFFPIYVPFWANIRACTIILRASRKYWNFHLNFLYCSGENCSNDHYEIFSLFSQWAYAIKDEHIQVLSEGSKLRMNVVSGN